MLGLKSCQSKRRAASRWRDSKFHCNSVMELGWSRKRCNTDGRWYSPALPATACPESFVVKPADRPSESHVRSAVPQDSNVVRNRALGPRQTPAASDHSEEAKMSREPEVKDKVCAAVAPPLANGSARSIGAYKCPI